MGITDKTRKILWGQAGSRCSMCRCELVVGATGLDPDAVVGDECHIISRKPNGPRYDPDFPISEIDLVGNLLLLCRTHHKLVDDQPQTYTADILRSIRTNHENWVASKLNQPDSEEPNRVRRVGASIPSYFERLNTGQSLMAVVGNACAYSLEHAEPNCPAEAELLGGFLQNLRDWAEMWTDIEPAERSKVSYSLTEQLAELKSNGFFVFGAREIQRSEGGGKRATPWPVAIVRVARADSPEIVRNREE